MSAIKLTAKRQATLPKALCDEMGLHSGDTIHVERSIVDGKPVWLLRPPESLEMPWFGSLKRFARGKPHDMESIRKSIAEGRKRAK